VWTHSRNRSSELGKYIARSRDWCGGEDLFMKKRAGLKQQVLLKKKKKQHVDTDQFFNTFFLYIILQTSHAFSVKLG
jgi:hypothetical protein